MSEQAWRDDADTRLTDFIAQQLDETTAWVKDWVLVVTFVDDAGEDCTAFNSHPNSKRTSTLGMLKHATTVQEAAIFWDERPDA